jgi:hypothetical protein
LVDHRSHPIGGVALLLWEDVPVLRQRERFGGVPEPA